MRGFSHFQLHFPHNSNSNYDNNNQRQFNVIYLSLVASSSCVNRAKQKQIQQHRPFKMLRVLYCSAVNKCYELIQSNAFELSWNIWFSDEKDIYIYRNIVILLTTIPPHHKDIWLLLTGTLQKLLLCFPRLDLDGGSQNIACPSTSIKPFPDSNTNVT